MSVFDQVVFDQISIAYLDPAAGTGSEPPLQAARHAVSLAGKALAQVQAEHGLARETCAAVFRGALTQWIAQSGQAPEMRRFWNPGRIAAFALACAYRRACRAVDQHAQRQGVAERKHARQSRTTAPPTPSGANVARLQRQVDSARLAHSEKIRNLDEMALQNSNKRQQAETAHTTKIARLERTAQQSAESLKQAELEHNAKIARLEHLAQQSAEGLKRAETEYTSRLARLETWAQNSQEELYALEERLNQARLDERQATQGQVAPSIYDALEAQPAPLKPIDWNSVQLWDGRIRGA